jgi:hypothetical protein
MFKITAQIEADGNKQSIYQLKEYLFRLASQHSCKCNFTITSDQGFQEMISASFQPIIDVSVDDIVDLTLTGDEQYELLTHQEGE